MNKKRYPREVLDRFLDQIIEPLGNPEYQERIWVRGEGPEIGSYDEDTMNFNEDCEKILEKPEDFEGIDEENIKLLQILYDMIAAFDEHSTYLTSEYTTRAEHKLILSDPKWHEIQNFAKLVYRTLKKRK